jgi:hypothetical protein
MLFEAAGDCPRCNFAPLSITAGKMAQKNSMKMKLMMAALAVVTFMASCGITSNTTIEPKKQFVLGNNEHGSFKVKMKNLSSQPVEVYQAPLGGGSHSGSTVQPGQLVTVKVQRNTALIVNNQSADTVSVYLQVTGDAGLSMGYNNGRQ